MSSSRLHTSLSELENGKSSVLKCAKGGGIRRLLIIRKEEVLSVGCFQSFPSLQFPLHTATADIYPTQFLQWFFKGMWPERKLVSWRDKVIRRRREWKWTDHYRKQEDLTSKKRSNFHTFYFLTFTGNPRTRGNKEKILNLRQKGLGMTDKSFLLFLSLATMFFCHLLSLQLRNTIAEVVILGSLAKLIITSLNPKTKHDPVESIDSELHCDSPANRFSSPTHMPQQRHTSAALSTSVQCSFQGCNLSAFLSIHSIAVHSPSHLSVHITPERRVLTMLLEARVHNVYTERLEVVRVVEMEENTILSEFAKFQITGWKNAAPSIELNTKIGHLVLYIIHNRWTPEGPDLSIHGLPSSATFTWSAVEKYN